MKSNNYFRNVIKVKGLAALCVLLTLCISTNHAFAALKTWTSTTVGGVWTTSGNWTGGTPVAGDDVVINNTGTGFAITAVPTISLNSITIGGTGSGAVTLTGTATTLTFTSTTTPITVSNNLTLSSLAFNATSAGATATLAVAALKTFTMGANNVTFAGGIVSFGSTSTITNLSGGTFTLSNTTSFDFSNLTSSTFAGTLAFTGTSGNTTFGIGMTIAATTGVLSINAGRTSSGTAPGYGANATLTYTGSAARTVSVSEWSNATTNINLTTSNTSTLTLDAGRTVVNLTINAGCTIADAGNTLNVTTNVTNNGTHSGAGKISLNGGAASHTVTGTTDTYGNLELNDAQGATFANTSGTTTVTGTLTVTAGTLTLNAFTTGLTVSTATNVTGTLVLGNATGTRSLGNVTINTGGVINVTTAPVAPLVVTDLNVNGGTWNNSSNVAVTVNGSITQNGTFTSGTGIYTLAGAAKSITTTSSALSINSVTVSGTYSVAAAFGSGNVFSVPTALIVSAGTSSLTNNGFVSSPSVTVTTAGGAFTNNGSLTVTTGAGVLAGGGTFTNAATGTLNFAGTAAPTITTFTTTAAGNTVVYNAAATQTARGTTYSNLTISPTAAIVVSLAAATTVSNNLSITTGTFSDASNQITGNASGILSVANGATLQIGSTATATTFPTAYTNANIQLAAGSTVNYASTGAQNISSAPTYSNLTVTGASVKTVLTPGITVNGNLNVATSGETLSDGGFQIVGNGTGTLTVAAGSTLQIGAAGATTEGFPTLYTTANISLNATSTVNYNTTGAQPVAGSTGGVGPGTYGNLTVTGASVKTVQAAFTVAGVLTIATVGETFADNGFTVTANGNVTNSGTHSSTGSGEIKLSSAAAQTVTGTATNSFGNIESANTNASGATFTGTGATTVTGNINVSSGIMVISSFSTSLAVTGTTTTATGTTLTINSATGTKTFTGDVTNNGTWNNSGNSPITLAGNLTNNGTFTSGSGLYTLTGASKSISTTNASALSISNITINSTGTYTVSANFGSGNVFSIPTALTISTASNSLTNNGFMSSPSVTVATVGGSFTNNGSLTVTTAGAVLTGSGTFTNTGTGTLNYAGTAAPAITTFTTTAAGNTVVYNSATTTNVRAVTYSNLTSSTTGIATCVTPGITVSNNLAVTSGTLSDGGFQIVGNASGLLTVAAGATLQLGVGGATTTNLPTLYTTGNITLNPTSTEIYNTTSAITISATPSAYGNLTLSSASTKTAGGAHVIVGALTINAGTFADGGFSITVNGNITNVATHSGAGNITLSGGSASHTLSGTGTFGNLVLNDANGAAITTTGGPFTVTINGTLTLTTGAFAVGGLSAASPTTLALNGPAIAGTPANLTTTTFSNLSFGPVTNANTNLAIPSSVTNLNVLTVNIVATNTVALNSSVNLNNTATALTLTSGLINLGANNLTIFSTTGTISGGSASSYIVATGAGQLMKNYPASVTTFTYPIGDNAAASDYSPVLFTGFTPNATITVGARVTKATHPQMNTPNPQTNYINRYWSFSTSGAATTYTFTNPLTLTFLSADIVGTVNAANTAGDQINLYNNTSSSWSDLNSTIAGTPGTSVSTTQTFSNTSAPLGGNDLTVRVGASGTYTWNQSAGGAWTTPANWTPARNTTANNDVLIFNGSTTPGSFTVNSVPTETEGQIQVINGVNVSLTSTASATLTLGNVTGPTNVLTIDATSTLQLSSAAAIATTIAFSGAPTNPTTNIAGTFILNTNNSNNNTINFANLTAANNTITGIITNNGGTVTSLATNTTFGSTAIYNHAMNGGTIPVATWNSASTINITAITTANPTWATSTYGNLNWNPNAQSTATGLTNITGVVIGGNLNVQRGTFGSSSSFTLSVTGTTGITNGATLNLASTGSQLFTGDITNNGTWTTGGSIAPVTIAGNFTDNTGATFTSGTGTYTLTGASKSIGGTIASLTFSGPVTVTSPGAYTNNIPSLIITGALSGTGSLTNAANNTLTLTGSNTITTFNTTASPNTVIYNGSGTTAKGTTYYNLTVTSAGTVTLGAATTVNNNLSVTTGTLADGTSLLTGNATGSLTLASATSLTLTNTTANPFPTFASYSLAATSNVNFNANAAQNIPSAATPYGNLTIAGGNTKTVTGGAITVAGNLTITTGTLADGGNIITVNGSVVNSGSHTGAGSINLSGGSAAHTLSGTGSYTNLTLNDANNAIIAAASSFTVNGALTLTTGNLTLGANTLTLAGTVGAGSGTFTGSATSSMTINGSGSLGTLNFTAGAQTLLNLTMSRGSSGTMTLGTNLSIGTAASGVLTLTNGIINEGSNLISINNTTATAVTGFSSSSFVLGSGGMARVLPASASAGTYSFPIGSSIYNLFNLITPTTNATGTVTLLVQEVDANSGGTPGTAVASLNTNHYWTITQTGGTGALTAVAQVALNETSPALTASNIITQSSTLTGTYQSLGGTVAAPLITSSATPSASLPTFFVIGTRSSNLCPGPYTIGSGGNFASLAAVASALNGTTVTCPLLFEFITGYTETPSSTITFSAISGTSATNTITIRPQSTVSTQLSTAGNPGANNSLINISGVSFMILDGRPGGSGSSSNWTVQNTSTSSAGPAIQLTSGANSNTLEYLKIQSSNLNTQSGTVALIAASASNTGNIIQNCNIGPNGTNYPAIGICAFATFPNVNSSNQVLNNQINDFHGTTGYGILVSGTGSNSDYGDTWTISGNSIFSTVGNSVSDGSVIGINFIPSQSSPTSTGNTISNNTIGGNQPVTGGSAPLGTWFTSANNSNQNSFMGIQVEAKSVTVSGNYIGNICELMQASQSGMVGIYNPLTATGGTISITGNTVGNTFGGGKQYFTTSTSTNTPGTGSKTFTVASGLPYVAGDSVIITSQSALVSASFAEYMIGNVTSYSGTSLVVNVVRNLGATSASSWFINHQNSMIDESQYPMVGIWATEGGLTLNTSISNNTVANLVQTNAVNSVDQAVGILTQSGQYTIQGNSVYNITANSVDAVSQLTTGTFGSVVGISQQGAVNGVQTVSQNTVYNLYTIQTSTSANAIYGIDLGGVLSSGTTHIADRNLVYGLSFPNAATGAQVYGMFLRTGTYFLSNNMVDLGIRTDGTSITGSANIQGITDGESGSSSSGTQKFYHNSIFIGGTAVVSGAINTYAWRRNNANSSPKDIVDVRNNIFMNKRANTSGTGKHYCIGYDSNNDLNLSTEDYNIDTAATTTGGVLAQVGGVDQTTFAAIRTSTGNANFDLNSQIADPQFLSPTTATPSLDINPSAPTPIEGSGTAAATTTFDFHGNVRANLTPVDIGADAGNFMAIDRNPPTITYTPFSNGCNGTTSYSVGNVTITDPVSSADPGGLNTASGTSPRLYYKKKSDVTNTVSSTNNSSVSGWKWVQTSSTSSPFNFTIDYTLLFGGGVSSSDTIQYLIIAQDQASPPNIGWNPGAITISPASTSVDLTGKTVTPTNANIFTISPCSGTVTVGTGGNYPSLTNAGGLFQSLNGTTLTGPLTAQIISDLTAATEGGTGETGTFSYNLATSPGSFTVTIQPNSATLRTISGAVTTNPMIPVSGSNAINLTIDGSFNGDGLQHLTFRNTGGTASTTGPVIQFDGGATANTLKNTFIESNGTNASSGAIVFGATTGNTNNNTVTKNNIHASSGNSLANGIYNNTATNASNTITSNNLYDFTNDGILLNNAGNTWTISSNNFYMMTGTPSTTQIAVSVQAGTGHIISNNLIGGNATPNPTITGTWTNSGAVAVTGISLAGTAGGTVSNNTISNMLLSSTSVNSANGPIFTGISTAGSGTITISGNTVGSATTSQSIVNKGSTGSVSIAGISASAGAPTGTISSNTIANLYADNTTGVVVRGIVTSGASAYSITGNSIFTLSAPNSTAPGTSASGSVVGIAQSATGSPITISQNTVYGLLNGTTGNTAVQVTGIFNSSGVGATITQNKVHSFSTASTSITTQQTGIWLAGTGASGAATVANNVVRLGIDVNGSNVIANNIIVGIDKPSSANANIYYNSVYIGGTGVSTGAANTYAFRRTGAGTTDDIRNNIFSNERSNGTTGGTHYSISNPTNTGLTMDYNLYRATGANGSVLATNTVTNLTTLQAIRASSNIGQNLHSGVGNPNFVNATGTAAAIDLSLGDPSAAEDAATAVSVTTDFTGAARNASTPDIGAYEEIIGSVDIYTPVIAYTALGSSQGNCGTNPTITATITDVGTGVPTSGSFVPQLWFKKSTSGTWIHNSGVFNSGTGNNGTWTFTIDYTLLGGVSNGDVIQYYMVAQDMASPVNIWYNPFDATTPVHSDVNTQVTPPTAGIANSFTVANGLAAGTYTVCPSGCNYATLTAAAADYNSKPICGPVVFSLTSIYSSASETFPITFNNNTGASATNTLTIKPASGASPTISGSSSIALVRFNGCSYVTLDGSNGNTADVVCPKSTATRNLTIVNNNTSFVSTSPNAIVWIQNNGSTSSATNNTVKNCIVYWGGNCSCAGTGIGIGGNTGTSYSLMFGNANNNNSIINNDISGTNAVSGLEYGILIQGGSISNKDHGNYVAQNIVGFTGAGAQTGYLIGAGIAAGFQDGLTITGDSINGVYNSSFTSAGIALGVVNSSTASGGLVFFDATNTYMSGNEVTNSTITKNNIGLVGTNGSGNSVAGIVAVSTSTGTNLFANNEVTGVYGVGLSSFFNSFLSATVYPLNAGIYIGGGSSTNVFYNSLNNASTFYSNGQATPYYNLAIGGSNPVVNVKNNILYTSLPSGTTSNWYLSCLGLGYSTFTNLSSNNNDFFVSGSSGSVKSIAYTGTLQAGLGTSITTLSGWQTTSGGDGASKNVAPVFQATTNLRLVPTNTTNTTNLAGTGIAVSVTDDIDCNTRDANPDMGFQEFVQSADVALTNFVVPVCATGSQPVKVILQNTGASTITSVTVAWSVNSISQTTQNFSSLSVAPGATTTLTLGNFTFTSGTTYNLSATSSNPNGSADATTSDDNVTATLYAGGLPATVYIGSGAGTPNFATYSSLFSSINTSGLSSNLNVFVQNNTAEPSLPTFLNATTACAGGPYSIFITPVSATTFTASGSSGSTTLPGMIGFNGAARVYIDGQFSGDGIKHLVFRNTSTANPAVGFIGDANTITISNCDVQSANATTFTSGTITNAPGVVFFGNGSSVGNNNISLSNNNIRDRSDAAGVPAMGIFSLNSGSGTNNTITIQNNQIFNFFQNGVYISPTGNGPAWNISNNSFYASADYASLETAAPQQVAIYHAGGSGSYSNTISGNTIGGNASGNGGTWLNSLSNIDFEGIRLDIGGTGAQTTTVSNNTLKHIHLSGTSFSIFVGIRVKNGLVNVTYNSIGELGNFGTIEIDGNGDGTNTHNTFAYGIWNYSPSNVTIRGNTVGGVMNEVLNQRFNYITGIRHGYYEYWDTPSPNFIAAGTAIIDSNKVAELGTWSGIEGPGSGFGPFIFPNSLTGIMVMTNSTGNVVSNNTINNLTAGGGWTRNVGVAGISLDGKAPHATLLGVTCKVPAPAAPHVTVMETVV